MKLFFSQKVKPSSRGIRITSINLQGDVYLYDCDSISRTSYHRTGTPRLYINPILSQSFTTAASG